MVPPCIFIQNELSIEFAKGCFLLQPPPELARVQLTQLASGESTTMPSLLWLCVMMTDILSIERMVFVNDEPNLEMVLGCAFAIPDFGWAISIPQKSFIFGE